MKDSQQVNSIVSGIIDYLTTSKSLDLLPEIAERLIQESWVKIDPDLARVYSPIKLSKIQLNDIKKNLSLSFKRPIRVKAFIDKKIIAGFRIKVAGKTIDATANQRLEELKKQVLYD